MAGVLSSIRQPERRERENVGCHFKLYMYSSAIVLGPLVLGYGGAKYASYHCPTCECVALS